MAPAAASGSGPTDPTATTSTGPGSGSAGPGPGAASGSADPADGPGLAARSQADLVERLAAIRARLAELAKAARAESGVDDGLRGLYVPGGEIDRILGDPEARGPVTPSVRLEPVDPTLRIGALAAAFGLDDLDVELLLVALAPELDHEVGRLVSFLDGDPAEPRPTVRLALMVSGRWPGDGEARARLLPGSALVEGGLVEIDDPAQPLVRRTVRVPDRVVQHLLGRAVVDPLLRPHIRPRPPPVDTPAASAVAAALTAGAALIHLRDGGRDVGPTAAAAAAARLGLGCLVADLQSMAHAPGAEGATFAVGPVVAALRREARLTGALLVVGPAEVLGPLGVLAGLAEGGWPTAVVGRSTWDPAWSTVDPYPIDVDPLDPAAATELWATLLDGVADPDLDVATATATFKLSPDQVQRASAAAFLAAHVDGRLVGEDDLRRGARAQDAAALEALATRIRPAAVPEDIILPAPVLDKLNELCDRARLAERVYGEMGLARPSRRQRGVAALFAGPPGTGKTLAAEIIAGALGLDLYVVDLATVVDKYIGETEKNLERIFTGAEAVNAVLLFDEADALFGKRSAVSDARDRYANIEVAYLLQRVERFEGTTFLTTNLRSNVDDAFLRRLDGVVDFPTPDADLRATMWERFLGSVRQARDIDVDFLADRFVLSGGHIKNAVTTAAFRAAAATGRVTMEDLVIGVAREYAKLGRLLSEAEFGSWLAAVQGTGGADDGEVVAKGR